MTKIDINNGNVKQGLLGLVIALVEIIRDALRLQAMKRIDSGRLSDEEIERLGLALAELEEAIEKIKEEHDVAESVRSVRSSLDNLVDDMVGQITDGRNAGRS